MTKTNRRIKPATDNHLANIASERTPSPSQPLPRKSTSQRARKEGSVRPPASAETSAAPTSQSHSLPRSGSKQALILSLLSRQQGASLAELMAATGWLAHTTRAALTGLRQRGCTIERFASDGGSSTYRITNATPVAADGESA